MVIAKVRPRICGDTRGVGLTAPGDHRHTGPCPRPLPTASSLDGLYPISPGMPPPTLAVRVPPSHIPEPWHRGHTGDSRAQPPDLPSSVAAMPLPVASGPVGSAPPPSLLHIFHLESPLTARDLAGTRLALHPRSRAARGPGLLTHWPPAPAGSDTPGFHGGQEARLRHQALGCPPLLSTGRLSPTHPPRLPGSGRTLLLVGQRSPPCGVASDRTSSPTPAQPWGHKAPPPGRW